MAIDPRRSGALLTESYKEPIKEPIEPYIPELVGDYGKPTPSILTIVNGKIDWAPMPTAAAINKVADTASERQQTIAAVGEVIPIVYGRQRLGAKIALVHDYSGDIYILAVWALGVNEEIESIYINNDTDIKGTTNEVASYTGSLTQTRDPTLASILPGYSDDLIISRKGGTIPVCYSVLRFPSEELPSTIQVVLKGLKLYDPSLGVSVYSTVPALGLNDILTNPIYGFNKTVTESSVIDVKAFNNALMSDGNVHRSLNLAITSMAKLEQHIELLRVYAGCYIVDDGVDLKLVPDTVAGTITRSFTESDFVKGSVTVTREKKVDVPTVVTIKWTNTQVDPWRDDPATVKLAGVDAGTLEWRESVVNLPGITSYSQAYREAVERLNRLNFSDLTFEADTFDESLQDQIGDIAYFTHYVGLTDKPMKLTECSLISPGRWHIVAREHADANYSNEIQTEPTEPDTSLPSPQFPSPPTGLILTEDVFTSEDYQTVSRIHIQWTAPVIGFVEHYRIKIVAHPLSGAQLVYETTTTSTDIYTDIMVYEGEGHDVSVLTYSGIAYSDPLEGRITLVGSAKTPDSVQSFSGLEAGGKVFLSWNDTNSLPIKTYEIRYGSTSSTWDSGSVLLTKVDGVSYIAQGILAGVYKFHIKANSYYDYLSPSASTVTVTITIDSDYLAETIHGVMDEENSTNMLRSYKSRHNLLERYVQGDGTQTFAQTFSSNMSTYFHSNGIFFYMEALAYTWKTKTMDFDTSLTGMWKGDIAREDYGTASQDSLLLSSDGISFDSYTDMMEDTTARYAQLQVYDSSGKILLVNEGSKVCVNVLSIKENGSITSSRNGPKTVGLNNFYEKVVNITVTPKLIDSVTAVVDNIVVSLTDINHFDIYVFDNNNDLVETECFWRFEGL